MASGKDLKRRIASVKSTQQITKAMKMVAASRLRRAQDAIVQARPYASGIHSVVATISASDGAREFHPLLAKREVKKVNVILITSDRGLCGGFNANLVKRAEALYKEEASKYEKFVFTCIGKRGFEYLNIKKIPVHQYHLDFFKGLNAAKAFAEADKLVQSFVSGEFDEIRIIYAEFKSAISQIVRTQKLLPVELDANDEKAQKKVDFIFEPNRDKLLEELLPRYIRAQFFKALLESLASEHGARMAAMDNATKNAGEMIRKLTLEFNKIRQAGITKELLEIVSGAEALK